MRKIKIQRDYYNEGVNIFKKSQIEIKPGLTVLVGCNGSGKTTLLHQIKQNLQKENILFLSYDNFSEGKDAKQKSLLSGDIDLLASFVLSSEGESIVLNLGQIARQIGKLVRDNPDKKEIWILFDAIDSGLSIDNIVDVKNNLIKFVIAEEKGKDIYFVVCANSYEMCMSESCFDVVEGEYIGFRTYYDYRRFILESKEIKEKRA